MGPDSADGAAKKSGTKGEACNGTVSRLPDPGPYESDTLFRDLSENSSIGIYVVQDRIFRYVNDAFAHIHGYEREDVIGKMSIDDTTFPEDVAAGTERGRLRRAGLIGSEPYESRIVTKGGQVRKVRVYASNTTYQGRPAFIGTMFDITEEKATEAALAQSRAQVQAIVDSSPVGISWSDHQGNLVYVNERFEELFGYTLIDIPTVERWRLLAYPDEAYRQSVSTGVVPSSNSVLGAEAWIRCKDGTHKLIRRARAVAGDYVVIIYTDMTEQKKAEMALKENEERLQALMDAAPMGVRWSDLEGNFVYLNKAFEEMFGYTLREIPNLETWQQLAYPDPAYRDTTSPALREEGNPPPAVPKSTNPEAWMKCKDGSHRYVWRARSVAAGRVIVIYVDITEREKTAGALLESRKQLSEALKLAKAAHWELDRETLTYTFNDALYALYGTTAEEQGGYTMSHTDYASRFVHPDDISDYFSTFNKKSLQKQTLGASFQTEYRGRRPDGRDTYVLSRTSVVMNEDRRIRLMGMNQDVTEEKTAEAELSKRADELARSNAELEQFAYVASHDLQEPLRMVASYTELVARRYKGKLDADADEFIGFAVDGANRMKRLINDLLTYSRVGTRGKPAGPTSADSALRQALMNLSMSIEEKGAEVTAGPLPIVIADESQLIQLFQNLVGNAVKFHEGTDPRVDISAETRDGEWVFAVKDNGIGIEPEYFERIFLIFQRLHKSGTYPGTGIGLAVCKRIVERHGGRLWVESEPGKGSTFYFTLSNKGEKKS